MATRSRIGVILPDGKVQSVYCHWDGYPTGVGDDLVKTISTYKQAKDFVDEGDHSSVEVSYNKWRGEEINFRIDESKEAFWANDNEEYGYLFNGRKWTCIDSSGNEHDLY